MWQKLFQINVIDLRSHQDDFYVQWRVSYKFTFVSKIIEILHFDFYRSLNLYWMTWLNQDVGDIVTLYAHNQGELRSVPVFINHIFACTDWNIGSGVHFFNRLLVWFKIKCNFFHTPVLLTFSTSMMSAELPNFLQLLAGCAIISVVVCWLW